MDWTLSPLRLRPPSPRSRRSRPLQNLSRRSYGRVEWVLSGWLPPRRGGVEQRRGVLEQGPDSRGDSIRCHLRRLLEGAAGGSGDREEHLAPEGLIDGEGDRVFYPLRIMQPTASSSPGYPSRRSSTWPTRATM